MDNVLKGKLGFKGERGFSAYEIAVQNGYVGTEKDWLSNLGTTSKFERDVVVYTAIAGQAEFDLPSSYVTGSFIDVYVEGERLSSEEYTLNEGKIVLTNAITVEGTKIEVVVTIMSTNELPIIENLTESSTNDTVLGAGSLFNLLATNVKNFGAKGDGVTDDTEAIQKAIDYSNYVYIPDGVFCYTKLKLKSNLVIVGNNATLKSLNVTTSGNDASIVPEYENNKIENVYITGITFEGNKENISHEHYDVIGFFAFNDERIKNITINNCKFNNFKEDGIRFMYSKNADISDISIKGCDFYGVTNDKPSLNGIRFVMDSYIGTYGYYPINNVYVYDCKGEMIRTLCDIKRGCQNVIITNCFTHNMNDCHNSIDGSKNVIVANIISSMDNDFTPTTGANFIEIQGEDITVKNIIGEGSAKVRDGLQITDYGHPDESDLGHNSKNIMIFQCLFKNVTRNGYNIMNGNNIKVSECSIENAGAHSYTFVSGDGRNGTDGSKIVAGLNHLVNSNELNCAFGLKAKNMINDDIILNVDNVKNENGYFRYYGNDLLNKLVMSITKTNPINLNPELAMTDTNVNFYTSTNVTCTQTSEKNIGCYNGVKVTDSLDTKLGELECQCKFKAKKDDIFTFVVNAKKIDTTYFSVVVKEYNGSEWLVNTFISSSSLSGEWDELVGQCKIQNQNTTNVVICLVPSAGYNNPTATGSLYISGFEVYKI